MVSPDKKALDTFSSRIGYEFKNIDLLRQALTHKSFVNDDPTSVTNERLEFLGDRVLGLVTAQMICAAFPDADEGELHRRQRALIRKGTCADIAREINLGKFLILGKSEIKSGGRTKQAILGDACEAVLAAVYLDAGYEQAAVIVDRHWRPRMEAADKPKRDAKSALQEWAQGQGLPPPVYEEKDRSGPDHEPVFTVRVVISGLEPVFAKGRSKRDAEQGAAENTLIKAGMWQEATSNE